MAPSRLIMTTVHSSQTPYRFSTVTRFIPVQVKTLGLFGKCTARSHWRRDNHCPSSSVTHTNELSPWQKTWHMHMCVHWRHYLSGIALVRVYVGKSQGYFNLYFTRVRALHLVHQDEPGSLCAWSTEAHTLIYLLIGGVSKSPASKLTYERINIAFITCQ